jgi:hypothetical protein
MTQVRSGSDRDIRVPAFKDVSDEEILDKYKSAVDLYSLGLDPRLLELEESNLSKFGPRSIAKPWVDRKETLYAHFQQTEDNPLRNVDLGIALGRHYGRGAGRFNVIDIDAALQSLPSGTAAGLPTLGKKRELKSLSRCDLLSLIEYCYEHGVPSILYTRTQELGKTRDTWGQPAGITVREAQFYRVFLEAVESGVTARAAVRGPDAVDAGITAIFDQAQGDPITSIDFSAYDASVSAAAIPGLFGFIATFFQEQHRLILETVAGNFRSGGIVTPDGVLSGDHGVPSGSVFTNLIDSMFQLAAADVDVCQVQGDDGVYLGQLEYWADKFRHYGLNVNMEKSDCSPDYAIYLQNYYSRNYTAIKPGQGRMLVGIYPLSRALNRLVHLERWTDLEDLGISGPDFFSIRAIAILENCKHHPGFPKLVKFIQEQDKYNLNFSEQGLNAYVESLSRRAPGLLHQRGDNVKGIRSFEAYKLLQG